MTSPPGAAPAAADEPLAARAWCWGGLAFVVAALALLELLDPYFFCQDDALALELPCVLLKCRSLWQGIIPTYNPYTFLGSPAPSIDGFYSPLFLAYGIARHLLADEYATFDVFAAMHILAGYCLMFVVVRRLGVRPMLAALASLSFVLSGPVVVMGRCWHSFVVLAALLPLFALLVDMLRTGPVTWRWPLGLGLALGAYYHSGFPQLFLLGCGMLLLHAAALAGLGLVPLRRLRWVVPALAFGAAISMPIFYQQWRLSGEISTNAPGKGVGVAGNLLPMLLPYPFARGSLPNDWGSLNLRWNGQFYYFGTVLLVAFLAAVATLAWRGIAGRSKPHRLGDSARLQLALAIPAVVAFVFALGESGGLWRLMDLLPVGLRNNPFRAMPWFVCFACLVGARYLEDLFAAGQDDRVAPAQSSRSWLPATVTAVGLGLLCLHLAQIHIAFYTYGFRPYPPLPTSLTRLIDPDEQGRQQRIMSFASMRSIDPTYPLALFHNLPCVYAVPAVFGYDPLIQKFNRYHACFLRVQAQPQAALAAYGVRRLLIHRTAWGGWRLYTPNTLDRLNFMVQLLEAVDENPRVGPPELDEYLKVIELPRVSPLAFDAASPTEPLPLRMNAVGLDIDLTSGSRTRNIVANFLRYPDMVATTDGEPVAVDEDEWQRIVVRVPAGARQIRIRYSPPRAPGIAIASILAAAGLGAMLACGRGQTATDGSFS
jgi:hypothetical protein